MEIDELAIEQRVQEALEKLRTTGEPGLGVIEPAAPVAASPVAPASGEPAAAPAPGAVPQAADDSVTAAELEYVLTELGAEGYAVERITIERALALSRMYARTSAQP